MTMVLGIDTGGTYTDGVILNRETKQVITAAKSLTTHENLIEGIRNVIKNLDVDGITIDYTALSTTLATNAIVEEMGCRVGLLCLGYTPEKDLPPCECTVIPGEMNLSGNEITPVDLEAAKKAVYDFGDRVDAIAISGIFSVRNPDHENAVYAAIKDILNVPVVLAHDLSGTLGVYERTNTAVLNARLISVITDLLRAVKAALAEKQINAPLMIVKGDGGLMTESIALERPIDTILSGPAASIIGATYLNDVEEGLVLDMGGTTTDIALLSQGRPRLTKEGAMVGGWRTRVSAVSAYTSGLGGDSRISWNRETSALEIGPRRSNPLSKICRDYPGYKNELVAAVRHPVGLVDHSPADGLILLNADVPGMELTPIQKEVLEALADGPHTFAAIGRKIGKDANFIRVENLISHGVLGLVGFTPSDVLCALGEYEVGDKEAAKLGALILAQEKDLSFEYFSARCFRGIREKMCRCIFDSVLGEVEETPYFSEEAADFFLSRFFGDPREEPFSLKFDLHLPIVGMGAPIRAWLPGAAEKFGVEPVISLHHDVANAVGAAAGKLLSSCSLLVRNQNGEYLTIYAPWGKTDIFREQGINPEDAPPFEELIEKAVALAIEEGKEHLKKLMTDQGICDYQLLWERKDAMVSNAYNDNVKLYIETEIDVVATGLPSWLKKGQ